MKFVCRDEVLVRIKTWAGVGGVGNVLFSFRKGSCLSLRNKMNGVIWSRFAHTQFTYQACSNRSPFQIGGPFMGMGMGMVVVEKVTAKGLS